MKHLAPTRCIQRYADVAKQPVWFGGLFNAGDAPREIERYRPGVDAIEQILSRRFTRLVFLPRVSYRQASQVNGSLMPKEDGHPLTVLESRKPAVEVVGRHNPRPPGSTLEKAFMLCFTRSMMRNLQDNVSSQVGAMSGYPLPVRVLDVCTEQDAHPFPFENGCR